MRWLGVLPRDELARVCAAAEVFVFPSRSETFGLEVLGEPDGSCHCGVMHEDLKQACYGAMAVPQHEARARALDFSWAHAAQLFERHLVPVQGTPGTC